MAETVKEDAVEEIFDRKEVRESLRFLNVKALHPPGGIGTLATFEVELADLLRMRGCRLRRKSDGSLALNAGLLEGGGGFAFDLRPWLRRAIVGGAVEALRGKLQKDLVALEKDTARAEEADVPAYVAGLDVAALPEQLMRAVRA
ncbi:hypothetical protein [Nitrobacter vulgaris]|uniref:Uncharacterized protein n=1 Tax=Nitrobacter vulgaris TaxID=29421 RepID=A0A1V4I2I8_NITVU|nr:hypothetical protein [Nitrobacter vulgaris]OPH84438.1 hypothetical protein B2M20_01475 [Nitrobacter vulgaris]